MHCLQTEKHITKFNSTSISVKHFRMESRTDKN